VLGGRCRAIAVRADDHAAGDASQQDFSPCDPVPMDRAVEVYTGTFGPEQAERLLWRAGFGPRRGEAAALARRGLLDAVHSLTRPGRETLVGPAPHDRKGRRLAPADAWGHDHAWWLDRMVRTTTPLVERMTLIWHDWFATSNAGVGSQRLMLGQNALFRRNALGSFRQLLLDVTHDPAMLLWLNGTDNEKDAPNENYGRELMELFTLGHGSGYGERDVREQARALTGWADRWSDARGNYDFHFDSKRHDRGGKRIFGHVGRFDWRDSCRLCLQHPAHPGFFVRKLWSYFVPTPPSGAAAGELARLYVRGGYQVRPVVEAILTSRDFYESPRLVKPPVVYNAGLLRAIGRGVDTADWAWIGQLAGQQLFYPPNVAGWDDSRWLDTATWRGRWWMANYASRLHPATKQSAAPLDAAKLVARAVDFWGGPTLSQPTRAALTAYASAAIGDADESWKKREYPPLIENALRQLVAVSPDLMTA
jgi:uncharacterized protein (DUF1800 family)